MFNRFHNDDGIIDDQTYRQDHAKQGQHIGGKTQHIDADVSPYDSNRNGNNRNQCGTKTLQEQEHHQHHQHHGLEKGVHHFLNRRFSKLTGVQNDLIFQPGRESGFQFFQQGSDSIRGVDCIGARLLIYDQNRGGIAIGFGVYCIVFTAQFTTADISHTHYRGVISCTGAQDDIVKLSGFYQHALTGNRKILQGSRRSR